EGLRRYPLLGPEVGHPQLLPAERQEAIQGRHGAVRREIALRPFVRRHEGIHVAGEAVNAAGRSHRVVAVRASYIFTFCSNSLTRFSRSALSVACTKVVTDRFASLTVAGSNCPLTP